MRVVKEKVLIYCLVIPLTSICHGRVSGVQAGVGIVARRIRYRAVYVQESKPVVGSIDST
jgi:hypothetical protein